MLLKLAVVILGVFEPCNIYGNSFIDGGINENIPWKALKRYGATKIISVIFSEDGLKECCNNMINVIDCSIGYLMKELREYELIGNTDIIDISTEKINLLDNTKIDELYEKGYYIGKDYINNNF